jgi:DNA-binding response OmpR family regulator
MVKVLVADDDGDIKTLMSLRLRRAGLDVHDVDDGPSALDHCRAERVDVAVLDVGMPGMSGLEVASSLRADSATSEMGIVLVSAMTTPADLRRGFEAGADAYLPKPFDLTLLASTVCELGARRRPAGASL